jgi:hypothetical protein
MSQMEYLQSPSHQQSSKRTAALALPKKQPPLTSRVDRSEKKLQTTIRQSPIRRAGKIVAGQNKSVHLNVNTVKRVGFLSRNVGPSLSSYHAEGIKAYHGRDAPQHKPKSRKMHTISREKNESRAEVYKANVGFEIPHKPESREIYEKWMSDVSQNTEKYILSENISNTLSKEEHAGAGVCFSACLIFH